MTHPISHIAAFLKVHGYDPQELTPLPGDASARRYYRLAEQGLLLMEEQANAVDLQNFVAISKYLTGLGLSAPRIYALDQVAGLALIEDFGQQTFTRLLATGQTEAPLYELAVEALVHLHGHGQAARPVLRDYNNQALVEELEMFTDWYVPYCAPSLDKAAFKTAFLTLWQQALADIAQVRDVLVLRDYHVDNLMVIANRQGVARCGLLDFQDGVFGAAAYDLVSLTQDARRDLAKGLEEHLVLHYLRQRPELNKPAFMADYWLLAAHRHTKILGNFERLSKRDGKHQYLAFIPRVQRQLTLALAQSGLDEISALMQRNLPGWANYVPAIPNLNHD